MNAKSKPSTAPWVDPDDAPETTKAWLKKANPHEGEKLIRCGCAMAIDPDVLAALRATGDGWQTRRINDMLRASLWLGGGLHFVGSDGSHCAHDRPFF